MIRVVLVDDNQVFRHTLELLLDLREEVQVVGSVDNGTAAAPLVEELQPDVVLLDYRLPGMNGLEVTRALRGVSPGAAVVCLTASVSRGEVDELYAAGAAACLTKDTELEEIVAAIVAAAG
jgi:NarL family two-component system response regulator LiaR